MVSAEDKEFMEGEREVSDVEMEVLIEEEKTTMMVLLDRLKNADYTLHLDTEVEDTLKEVE